LFAGCLQYADLEGNAVDARLAVLVRLQDGFLPKDEAKEAESGVKERGTT